MAVSLPYLSEVLFTAMVNRQREAFLSLAGLTEHADVDFIQATPELASRQVPLAPFGGRSFDGACRVDVVVSLRPREAVAFELKLGTTRLSKTRVDEEWLAPCSPSHNNRRWKGNMMAILDRRFDATDDDELAVLLNGERVPLKRTWFVVTRSSTLSSWARSAPAFSEHVKQLAFEEAVERFGGREPFNALVSELLAVDFYHEWVIGSDAA